MIQPHIIRPENASYVIYQYETIDSTNSFLKREYKRFSDNSVIWALEQTAGRGRFDRKWHAVGHKDLTFSLLVSLKGIPSEIWPTITQVTALSIVNFLEYHSISAHIKWPNDILVDQKKICGILSETVVSNHSTVCAIIGVGININSNRKELDYLDIPATSVFNELNISLDLSEILIRLLDNLFSCYAVFQQSGFAPFYSQLQSKLAYVNVPKTIIDGTRTYEGIIKSVASDGALLIQEENGGIRRVNSGEISFRDK